MTLLDILIFILTGAVIAVMITMSRRPRGRESYTYIHSSIPAVGIEEELPSVEISKDAEVGDEEEEDEDEDDN